MKKFFVGALSAIVLSSAASAQPVSFRLASSRFPESPAAKVYEARVRLADDEVLVVRELRRHAGGRLYSTDAIYDARGMDACYRIVCTPAHGGGTKLEFLSSTEMRQEKSYRTMLNDTRLEMDFVDEGRGEWVTYAWFARIEKLSDFLRRHPGYTPRKKPLFGAVSSGSRFAVPSSGE